MKGRLVETVQGPGGHLTWMHTSGGGRRRIQPPRGDPPLARGETKEGASSR